MRRALINDARAQRARVFGDGRGPQASAVRFDHTVRDWKREADPTALLVKGVRFRIVDDPYAGLIRDDDNGRGSAPLVTRGRSATTGQGPCLSRRIAWKIAPSASRSRPSSPAARPRRCPRTSRLASQPHASSIPSTTLATRGKEVGLLRRRHGIRRRPSCQACPGARRARPAYRRILRLRPPSCAGAR